MSIPFLANINLGGNQILGLRLETLATDPAGGSLYEGRLWYNSTDKLVKYYDGTAIIPWGTGGSGGVATLTVDNVTIENIGTATDPNLRVKALGISAAHIANGISITKFDPPTVDFSFNNHKLTSLTDPTGAQDAATKGYVDAVAAGLAPKDAVRAATTANGALATAFEAGDTIDGVTLASGDRVLIKNQTTAAENGIYIVQGGGAPVRALDADSSTDLVGAAVFVSEGTLNGNTLWVMTTDAPIVVNTTALAWAQFGGPGTYTAGTGLTLTGSQFSLDAPVSIANGGTGQPTAAAARTALGATTKFSTTIGDTVTTSFTITHNLNSRDVVVTVYDTTTFAVVLADVAHATVNTVTVAFAVAPANNAYRVVVVG